MYVLERAVRSRRNRRALGLGSTTIAGQGRAEKGADGATQKEVRIPISLYDGGQEEYEIAGTLTLPPAGRRKSVVQVLIHGITYARYYNDFPHNPDRYSYVQRATEEGYPTLNIDRIGIGESSHPLPELITLQANCDTIKQIVEKLRAGEIGDVAFPEVMLVGHSYGSMISTKTQADYGVADSIILTGFTQSYGQGKPFLAPIQSCLYPANSEEKFSYLPPGYLTTMPGCRDSFYYEPGAEEKMIALDEELKQTVTDAKFSSIPDEFDDSVDVHCPGA